MQEAVNIPVIHLIRLVVEHIRETRPEARRIGILASTAVLITGLYEKECRKKGLEVVYPDAGNQERLFQIIREIKAGNAGPDDRAAFKMVCDHLRDKGADLAVIACTELGVIADGRFPIETLDAAEILAREIVDVAKNRKSLSLLQAPRLG